MFKSLVGSYVEVCRGDAFLGIVYTLGLVAVVVGSALVVIGTGGYILPIVLALYLPVYIARNPIKISFNTD